MAEVAFEPIPGVTVTIAPLAPTPADLTAWGDRVVLEGVERSVYRVRNVEDLKTDRGWPVTIFFSDILSMMPDSDTVDRTASPFGSAAVGARPDVDEPALFGGPRSPAPSRVVERRMHALYLFGEYCGVVLAQTRTPARFDVAMAEIRRTLLTGDLDWVNDARGRTRRRVARARSATRSPAEAAGR